MTMAVDGGSGLTLFPSGDGGGWRPLPPSPAQAQPRAAQQHTRSGQVTPLLLLRKGLMKNGWIPNPSPGLLFPSFSALVYFSPSFLPFLWKKDKNYGIPVRRA
jgi:hypothetical protein